MKTPPHHEGAAAQPTLHLRLLGMPAWRPGGNGDPAARWQRLSRKDAALLARLALEGRQARSALAQWLWPQVPLPRAHANLRQRLYRLRQADGMLVDEDGEAVQLAAGVACDVWRDGCAADADFEATLLAGHADADDAIAPWLDDARRQWFARRTDAMTGLAARHEEAGELATALALTERLLALEPLLEHAWRRLMRLHARRGDRAAAIAAFERCERVLRDELGVRPSAETIDLLQEVEAGAVAADADGPERRSGPALCLPPRPALLIGRDRVVRDLGQRIGLVDDADDARGEAAHPAADSEAMRPLTVVHGWPGVGKSTLLAWLAHDPAVSKRFTDGVLWASLGESPDLVGELAQWTRMLGLPLPGLGLPTVDALSAALRGCLRERRVLLLIDDVWQPGHAAAMSVGGHACATVVSTRLPEVASALAPTAGDLYRLRVLTSDAGVALLQALTPVTVARHPEAARALVDDLEGLPLALHVAGRLLEAESRMGWGVEELLRELREGAALLQARAPHDMRGGEHAASPTVQALLRRSTDGLDPALRDRFALLGLFVPKPATFDLAAVAALWSDEDPRPTLRRLVDHGLLEPLADARFQMHALLVLHAKALLAPAGG